MRYTLKKFVKFSLVLLMACNRCDTPKPTNQDPEPATVTLEILPRFLFYGKPLRLNTFYQFPNGDSIRFTKAKFYAGNFTLQKGRNTYSGKGLVYKLINVGIENQRIEAGKYPLGTYTLFQFYVGLDAKTNASTTNTDDLDITTNSDMYWAWSKDYKFFVMEGYYKKPNQSRFEGFTFHVGGNPNLLLESIDTKITLSGDTTRLMLLIDVEKVFFGKTAVLDFDTQSSFHTVEDGSIIKNNYQGMFRVDSIISR